MLAMCALIQLVFAVQGAADPPKVDGLFDEWSASTLIATDPAGDASGAFDVTMLHAANNGTELFLHFDTSSVLNLQSGNSGDGTLRIELGLPDGTDLTLDLREREVYTNNNPGNFVPYSLIRFNSLSTYAADRFELRVDLAPLNVEAGDSIQIDFSGSDHLDSPITFTLESPFVEPVRRSLDREPCTTFRVANLNTLQGGLLDSRRGPAIGRLLQAAAADVYCFQEQNSSSSAIAAKLLELDPLGNGLSWNVHKSSDTIIAAQVPLIPVPRDGDAAAVADFGVTGAAVVFSIHPPCCGYIGSPQDNGRIDEMIGVVDTIADLRAGSLGTALLPYRYTPVVISGDWNLVGSRTPLDLLEATPMPGLSQRMLPHLIGDDVITWRDLNESQGDFSPGLLDLVTYSTATLLPRHGAVLDSTELTAAELLELGLQHDDSNASDHLLVVADFRTFSCGDLDGSGAVTPLDLALLLGQWGACAECPADLDGDGNVGAADLAILLGNWGGCP